MIGVGFTWSMANSRLGTFFTSFVCFGYLACNAAPTSTGTTLTNGNASSTGNGGTGNGGSGFVPPTSTGGSTAAVDGGQPMRCDANGQNCVCMNIAEIGTAGKFGSNPGQDGDVAFQTWMNDPANSNAHVDLYKTKPTLDATFLATYDVIVFQSLSDDSTSGNYWSFAQSEVDALTKWVNDGGAIISLTGYSSNTTEVQTINTLLNFSGISYGTDDIIGDNDCTLMGHQNPDGTGGQLMCYCATAIGVKDWNTADPAIRDVANHDPSVSSFQVGAYHGRPINAPSDAYVAATFTAATGTKYNVAVGKVVGKGHVYAWADEWITYTSQWDGTGDSHTAEQWCDGYLPQQIFQTAQYWYNMIKWSLPDAQCFQIHSTQQTVVVW